MTRSYYCRQSRQSRLHARGTPGGHLIKIGGEWQNIHLARLLYRCKECLCKLERRRAGLECLKDETHRGFIHRDEAAKIQAAQEANLEKIEAVYEIRDGQIVVKE